MTILIEKFLTTLYTLLFLCLLAKDLIKFDHFKSFFQIVVFGYDCMSLGEITHEVMHILGFSHEHTRPDRDRYVTILWDNIKPGMITFTDFQSWYLHPLLQRTSTNCFDHINNKYTLSFLWCISQDTENISSRAKMIPCTIFHTITPVSSITHLELSQEMVKLQFFLT